MQTPRVGSKLGPYELLAPIGAGGMGEVWRARDTRLDRIVAIKFCKDPFNARFEREARAIASLNHPNICQLYDVGPDYLVMECIEGRPIGGPLPLPAALKHAAQICDALDAAHRHGIVHRDLKPANVLVTNSGAKLLDFGLAKLAAHPLSDDGQTASLALTQEHSPLGTLPYMSPEQAQGKEIDHRSDIFSFGAVLYEMLTGKRAFPGDNAASVVSAVMITDPPPPPDPLPPALERVLRRCLAKEPDDRWQTARDLAAELRWIAAEGKPAAAAPARSRLAVAGTLVLVAMAAAGSFWLAKRLTPSAPYRKLVLAIEKNADLPVISPDGRKLAYTIDGKLRIRDFSQTEPVQIPDSVENYSSVYLGRSLDNGAFWSPDSQWVAYHAGGEIRRVSAEGGPIRTICRTAGAVQGSAWTDTPDSRGTITFAVNAGGIYSVPAEGGQPVRIVDNIGNRMYDFHGISFFGRNGAFLTWGHAQPIAQGAWMRVDRGNANIQDIGAGLRPGGEGVMSPAGLFLASDEVNGLVAIRVEGAGATWTADRRLIDRLGRQPSISSAGSLLYLQVTPGTDQLVTVDRAGRVARELGRPMPAIMSLRASPDGQKIAMQSGPELWVMRLADSNPARLVNTVANPRSPRWSTDGSKLGFFGIDRASLDGRLYVQMADSSSAPVVFEPGFGGADWDWCKDGGKVVYSGQRQGQSRNLFLKLHGSDKLAELANTDGWEDHPEIHVSGRLLAYRSNESGRFEIYVRSFPEGSGKWQVSANGGTYPHWSPRGDELFYIEGDTLMSVKVSTGAGFRVEGPPVRLFSAESANRFNLRVYSPLADGKGFVLARAAVDQKRALVLMENWWNELAAGAVR